MEESEDENYAKVKEMIETFEDRFGSTTCLGLTGCDLGTDEGKTAFYERELLENCSRFTEGATRMAMGILERRE